MKIEVTKVVVLLTDTTAKIILHFPFKSGEWPYQSQATATMQVAEENLIQFLNDNFSGIPTDVIETRRG